MQSITLGIPIYRYARQYSSQLKCESAKNPISTRTRNSDQKFFNYNTYRFIYITVCYKLNFIWIGIELAELVWDWLQFLFDLISSLSNPVLSNLIQAPIRNSLQSAIHSKSQSRTIIAVQSSSRPSFLDPSSLHLHLVDSPTSSYNVLEDGPQHY